jgi:hypothetical protein
MGGLTAAAKTLLHLPPRCLAAIILCCEHGDLLRIGLRKRLSSPVRDTSAIVSSYLGESVTEYLEAFMAGIQGLKVRTQEKTIDLGCREGLFLSGCRPRS